MPGRRAARLGFLHPAPGELHASAAARSSSAFPASAGKLTAWLVAPLILATVYDVAARYLFNAPTQWAYEVGYMMMGAHALLGMAFTLREGGHIRIDAFTQKFSQGDQGRHRSRSATWSSCCPASSG